MEVVRSEAQGRGDRGQVGEGLVRIPSEQDGGTCEEAYWAHFPHRCDGLHHGGHDAGDGARGTEGEGMDGRHCG